jgi:glycine C-acetyltransferase/8-amino-7-oxononanoate synthase
VSGPQGPHVVIDGKPVLLLCSDNYLGLADHPRVRQAAGEAAMRWGVGTGASRLVSGTMTIHRRLEDRLAAFAGRDGALLFGSGYLATAGVVAALAGPGDAIFVDELSHASVLDGCRLSGAEPVLFGHGDPEHLEWAITTTEARATLIVCESICSLTGELAPLEEIVGLAGRHGLRTVVDESHALGATGPGGRGVLSALELEADVDVIVGSLGKALGSYGAFVACDIEMREYLMEAARTFSLSTAPQPPAVAGALAALELIEQRPRLADRLQANAAVLREELAAEGFRIDEDGTHIVPLPVGDVALTARLCDSALARGVFAQAVTPPAVAPEHARLRLSVMASHRPAELRAAARTLAAAARGAGLAPHGLAAAAAVPASSAAASEAVGAPSVRAELYDFEARAA